MYPTEEVYATAVGSNAEVVIDEGPTEISDNDKANHVAVGNTDAQQESADTSSEVYPTEEVYATAVGSNAEVVIDEGPTEISDNDKSSCVDAGNAVHVVKASLDVDSCLLDCPECVTLGAASNLRYLFCSLVCLAIGALYYFMARFQQLLKEERNSHAIQLKTLDSEKEAGYSETVRVLKVASDNYGKELKRQMREHSLATDKLRKQIAASDVGLALMRGNLNTVTSNVGDLRKSKSALEGKAIEIEKQIKSDKSYLKEVIAAKVVLTSRVEDMKAQSLSDAARSAELSATNATLNASVLALKSQREVVKVNLDIAHQVKVELETRISDFEGRLHRDNLDSDEMRRTKISLEREVEQLKGQVEASQLQTQRMSNERLTLDTLLASVQKQSEEYELNVSVLSNANSDLIALAAEMQRNETKNKIQTEELISIRDSLNRKVGDLKETLSVYVKREEEQRADHHPAAAGLQFGDVA